jgi:hypothetical protein
LSGDGNAIAVAASPDVVAEPDAPAAKPEADAAPRKGIDASRATAKWLVAVFGALGAALIGGTSLQDFGDFSADGRPQAIVGFGLALLGAGVIVLFAARVLAMVTVSIAELASANRGENRAIRESIESGAKTVLRGRPSVEALARDQLLYQYEELRALSAIEHLPDPVRPDWIEEHEESDFEAALERSLGHEPTPAERRRAASKSLGWIARASTDLQSTVLDRKIERRFRAMMLAVVAGLLLAGAGAVMFTTAETEDDATRSAEEASPAVDLDSVPVTARLVVPEAQADRIAPLVGDGCDLDDVLVSVLDADAETVRVLVLPQDGCTSRQLALAPGDVALQPVDEAVTCNATTCSVPSTSTPTTVDPTPDGPSGDSGVSSG